MKSCLWMLVVLPLLCGGAAGAEKDASQYVGRAQALAAGGDPAGAAALLEEAAARYPEDSRILAHLGLYTGMSAGRTDDYMEAGRLAMRSFELLDAAVALDPGHPEPYLFRGIMGINVPEFMGKLDPGLRDLQRAAELYFSSPEHASPDGLVTALSTLAQGCAKKGNTEGQRQSLQAIVTLAPGSEAAAAAQRQLDELAGAGEREERPGPLAPADTDSETVRALKRKIQETPGDTSLVFALGEACYNEGAFAAAREVLREYVRRDPGNAAAYRLLALAAGELAGPGYDETIYEDTNYRSGLAFEIMNNLDRALELEPDDLDLRLMRGITGSMMPFFLGRHRQSVADLEAVIAAGAPDSIASRALYYLGMARRREATRYWIKVARDYPQSEAARLVYSTMRPVPARFDESSMKRPFVKIDFVLGFEDELPPQTAVWIEDARENYVATVYVSGFAGFVRERQVTLPLWAAISKFEGHDGVTGASIGVGHFIFAWDCTDHTGRRVPKGDYTVRVETSHWPSGKYQNVAAQIEVGGKHGAVLVEEGELIPFLEVTYRK